MISAAIYGERHEDENSDTTISDRKWMGRHIDCSLTEQSWLLVEKIPQNIQAPASHSQLQFINKKCTVIGWDHFDSLERIKACEKGITKLISVVELYQEAQENFIKKDSLYTQIYPLIEEVNQTSRQALKELDISEDLLFPSLEFETEVFKESIAATGTLLEDYFYHVALKTLIDRNLSLAETIIEHSNEDVKAIAGLTHVIEVTDAPEEQHKAVSILKTRLQEEDVPYEIFIPLEQEADYLAT